MLIPLYIFELLLQNKLTLILDCNPIYFQCFAPLWSHLLLLWISGSGSWSKLISAYILDFDSGIKTTQFSMLSSSFVSFSFSTISRHSGVRLLIFRIKSGSGAKGQYIDWTECGCNNKSLAPEWSLQWKWTELKYKLKRERAWIQSQSLKYLLE